MLRKILIVATFAAAALARTAQVTWYSSYCECCWNPKANQNECIHYSCCKYAGEFANGEKLTLDQVKNTPIVSFFDANNKSEAYWRKNYMNKRIRITKNGKTFIAYVKDTCADKDTDNNDCTRNSKGGFLIDIEEWTAKKYLGSTGVVDGTAEWEFV